jgi:hypothetical protein
MDLSRELVTIYKISFAISLCLILLIGIKYPMGQGLKFSSYHIERSDAK